jgi:tRNA A-37 threonylcarbamoyl transferase component Bud32
MKDPATERELPSLSGRFSVVRTLGSGAFGVVYEAVDRKLSRRVALKRLIRVDASARYRFKQEFRALAEVVHPNLVRLHELFIDDDHWWFTMELVEGVDFFTWIRGARQVEMAPTLDLEAPDPAAPGIVGALDEGRLRAATRQLALAVQALHRAGKLHLDLKPSNVLVANGRVVVLDFGLVADVAEAEKTASDERISGTPAYMSPEQAAGQALSPASDWYSVGLMMHEVLTGRLPFEGSPAQIMMRKQFADGPDPGKLSPLFPRDLCALVHELLRRDPAARPSADEVLLRLGEAPPAVSPSPAIWGERAEERRVLEVALDECKRNALTVEIAGPRGVGKSVLVQRFVEDRRTHGDALVLTGRCFQQESLPHKTLDGLIDSLTRHLLTLSREELSALMVPDVAALARLFPVLTRVDAVAQALPVVTSDGHELRRRGFAALREMLTHLGQTRPVVLVIDDVQWGDADGAVQLIDLVRPPASPTVLVLVLHDDATPSATLLALRDQAAASGVPVQELRVGPLQPAEAEALARRLLDGRGDVGLAPAIARESLGSPLLVLELARFAAHGNIGDALDARINALPAPAQRLLEVIALANRPLPLPVTRVAVGQEERDPSFDVLCAAELLRVGPGDVVECAHVWLRDAVRRRLDPATRSELHRRIAAALAAEPLGYPAEWPQADAEAVALHLRAGGAVEEARQWVARAAQAAVDQLQFGRAADLKRLALELGPPEEETALRRAWADALTDAGRAAEAARAYLELVPGADAVEGLRLRQRASEQLLRSGNVDEGLEVMAPVLKAVGLPAWNRPWKAVSGLVLNRLRLQLRDRDHEAHVGRRADEAELLRADVAWSMGTGLSGIDVVRGVAFHSRHTLLALDSGDPERIARALAWEAIGAAIEHGGDDRHGRRILVDAERAAERAPSIQARGFVASARAVTAWCAGRWRECIVRGDEAIAIFTAAPQKVAWEIGSLNAFWRLPAMLHTGDLEALGRRARECLREAEELGDRYIATTLRTNVVPITWMQIDKPDQARQESAEAIRQWSRDPTWHIQHWCDFFGQSHVDMYLGEGARALERLEQAWPRMRRAHLMRIATQRLQTIQLRAHCALCAAAEARGTRRTALIDAADRDRKRLMREAGPWPEAIATTLAAGVANLRGDRQRCLTLLADAERQYVRLEMMLVTAAVRRRRGLIIGGDEGRALVATADQFFAAQRVVRPERWAAALAPGCAP